jgi:cold shock CspA family protein
MAKSSDTFNKREKEKKRLQKRKDKEQRKEERKASNKDGKSFEEMIAYVDENGNFSATPPDITRKKVVRESEIDLTSRNKGGAALPYQRTGFVKFFDKDKGFGFIKDGQTHDEYFFYYTSANFPIAQSDQVSFETESGPKGMNAVRITKKSANAPAPSPAATATATAATPPPAPTAATPPPAPSPE